MHSHAASGGSPAPITAIRSFAGAVVVPGRKLAAAAERPTSTGATQTTKESRPAAFPTVAEFGSR
jgi:hypothetical protein